MYVNRDTVELAISKGYKHCTCSNGGYPDCICGNEIYCPVRLDDLHTWLRNTHNLYITVDAFNNTGKWDWRIQSIILLAENYNIDWEVDAYFDSYELAYNNGLHNALTLIK